MKLLMANLDTFMNETQNTIDVKNKFENVTVKLHLGFHRFLQLLFQIIALNLFCGFFFFDMILYFIV